MMVKREFIEVRTTTANRDDAQAITSALVEKRLAACVQVVGPITSTYWWQGKIESAEEYLCLAKCRKADYRKVEKAVRAAHPYQTPEIVAFDIIEGSAGYLKWLWVETRKA